MFYANSLRNILSFQGQECRALRNLLRLLGIDRLSNLYICLATGLLATFIDAEFISGIMGTNQQRC